MNRHAIKRNPLPKRQRSSVSNGGRSFVNEDVDYRTAESRRWRDLVFEFESTIPPDQLTEPRKQVVRRAATICLQCEKLEADLVAGRLTDPTALTQASGLSLRLMRALGLSTKIEPNPDAQTLEQYMAQMGAGSDLDDEAEDEDVD